MQVNPIKPTLKAPVSNSLKQKNHTLLSHVAFKFNSRHYIMVSAKTEAKKLAGSIRMVRRCRLTPGCPRLTPD